MIKITKRKFVEMLENNESVMLGVTHREVQEDEINNIMLDANYNEVVSSCERRKVIKSTPHRLTFSNSSSLDVDSHGGDVNVQRECFLYSNNNRSVVAITTTSKCCDDELYKTIIYYLIVK